MSGGTALAVVMSLSAGFAGSVQAAVLGKLGDRVGTVEAVGFSTLVAAATGIAVLLVARRSLHGVQASFHQPLWLWLGGILSAFIILSLTFAAPKIGVAAAIGLLISGNLLVAAAIDRFGWFGLERIPCTGRGCSGSCCSRAERRSHSGSEADDVVGPHRHPRQLPAGRVPQG